MSTNADIKIIRKKDKPDYDLIIGIETLAKWGAQFDFIDHTVWLNSSHETAKCYF